jgi:hypothetical protein
MALTAEKATVSKYLTSSIGGTNIVNGAVPQIRRVKEIMKTKEDMKQRGNVHDVGKIRQFNYFECL